MKTINQQQKILKYLQSHRAMTTLQARAELGIMHPASRVQELRAQGHNIVTHKRWVKTQLDEHCVAEYVLLKTNFDNVTALNHNI